MVTKEIALNIWQTNYITIYAQKGEVESRYVKASFKCQDETNLSLTGKTVTFYALKPDGTQIFNSCILDTTENTATVELTSQALSIAGILECEFQIFDSTNVLLKVTGLKVIISSNADFSEAVESTDEFNALTTAINIAQSFSSEAVRNVKVNGTSITQSANNTINIVTSDHSIPTSEQGTWTPQFVCIGGTDPIYTVSYTKSYYYRVGNLVHITFFMYASITNVGSGNAYISGLPFSSTAGTDRETIGLSVKGTFSEQSVLSVINGHSYIKIHTLSGLSQNFTLGNLYLGGTGCYMKS